MAGKRKKPPRREGLQLFYVCDCLDKCRAVVRANTPEQAAGLALKHFASEYVLPYNRMVNVHCMDMPKDGEPGALKIWSGCSGKFAAGVN